MGARPPRWSRSFHELAAVDDEDLAGDMRQLRGERDEGARDVLGRAQATKRRGPLEVGKVVWIVLPDGLCAWRANGPRSDHVDPNPLRAEDRS